MSGLQVHVQPPGLWARQKIIMALAESLQMELAEEECQRIASGVPDGVTAMQLRGILLQWMQQQHREPQDRDQMLQAMLLQQHRSHTPSLDLIAKAAARSLGVRLSEMRGNTKRSQIVRARGLAILMARRWTELSLQQIGDYFGEDAITRRSFMQSARRKQICRGMWNCSEPLKRCGSGCADNRTIGSPPQPQSLLGAGSRLVLLRLLSRLAPHRWWLSFAAGQILLASAGVSIASRAVTLQPIV
jgi:hypothetical protein